MKNWLGQSAKARAAAMGLLALLCLAGRALAQQTICAAAKIELGQEAALEREGFTATLSMTNNLADQSLSGLRIELIVKDANGQPAESLFFANVTSLEGTSAIDGTGTVPPSGTAKTRWLIIPSPGAGGTAASGVRYTVQARMSMLTGGVPRVVTTFPVAITVKPQPLLTLEYVLPFEVFGDEPLTEVHESTVPFPLGLRVSNTGAGAAKNFRVQSNQPLIMDNEQGLAVDFSLLGTWLGPNALPENTLLIPFGDIPAGGAKQAAWSMVSTLSGRFVNFTSTFTHAAELGGALTSLIQGVTTYTLIKDVIVDLPGRDAQFDFLVNVTTPRSQLEEDFRLGREPKPEFLMESDRPGLTPVTDVPAQLTGSLSGAGSVLHLNYLAPVSSNTWVHAAVPAPNAGSAPLVSVTRADGKVVSPRNAWISKHFDKDSRTYSYFLHVLDYTGAAAQDFSMAFNAAALDLAPAAIADLSVSTAAPGALDLRWTATGEDGGAGSIFGGRYAVFASTNPLAVPVSTAAFVSFSTNTAPGAAQAYRLTGLSGNATYYVAVFLADSLGQYSPASNLAAARTLAFGPQSVAVTSVAETSLAFSWSAAANFPGAAYRLTLSTAGGTAAQIGYLVDATTHAFSGLAPNTTHFLSAQARNADLLESPEAAVSASVTRAFAPLALPFTDVLFTSATANWAANGNPDGTEYRAVLSTIPAGAAVFDSGWVSTTSYAFQGLGSGASYLGRVRARNHAAVETAEADLGVLATVAIDTVAPHTELVVGTPSYAPSTAALYATDLTVFGLTAADDNVGVAATYLAIDTTTYSLYGGTFTLASEGARTLSFYSVDQAGNAEPASTATVAVDLTAPVLSLLVDGSTAAAGSFLVSTSALVSLSADDPVSNGVASGLREIRYAVDASSALVYSGAFTLSAGTHTLLAYAEDNLGRRSADSVSTFTVYGNYLAVSSDGAATLASSRADETITPVSPAAAPAAYAAAGSQGLALLTAAMYEIAPSPVAFVPPALLRVRFNPSGVSTATAALYRFDGTLWSSAPVTAQQVSVLASTSAVASGSLAGASLYGVFSTMTPPLAVSSIDPSSGTNAGSTAVTVDGTGFAPDASLKLSRVSPTANTWTSGGLMFFGRSRFPAVTLQNGRVLVEGGEGAVSSPNVSAAELFNPSSATWSITATMPSARRYHTATLLNDGKVLVAGGVGGNNTAILYDPTAGTWTPTSGNMASGHYYHSATLLQNGKVLIAGGFDGGATAVCALYDPATGLFSPTQSLNAARYYHTASLLPDGRVLVVGGLQGSTALASSEIYDPSAGTWSSGPTMSTARDLHTATRMADGKVLVAGGTFNGSAYRSSAEVYNPVSNAWTLVGSMSSARGYHTATLLPNGLVLVAAGFNGGSFLSSSELFDPASGNWSAGPSLTTARLAHAASLLADGRVLVTGGQNASGAVRAAEVYWPVSNVEIAATGVSVLDSTRLTGTLDLTGRPLGSWNVVVTNVSGSSAALAGGFTVLAVTPPTAVGDLAFSAVNPTSVTVRWSAPSAAGVAVTSYDLRVATFAITAANFASATPVAAPAPAAPGTVQTVAVTGAGGTSFHAALISRDAANTPSALSNVPSLQRSAGQLGGQAELTAWAGIPLSLAQLSTSTAPGSVALATASSQGLLSVSSLFSLGPQGAFFSPSATLLFRYSTAALAAQGVAPANVRIYQYADGVMTALSTQTLNASAQTFTASVSSPPALFGLFGFVPAPAVAAIVPSSGVNTGSVNVTLSGSGLLATDTLKLSRATSTADTWALSGSLATARSRFPAVLLPNGKVLVEGGEGTPGNPNISAAELFNPSSGTWSATAALPGSRRYHTATLLLNGKVLVAGGVGAETTALLYDPSAGTWSPAGTMVSNHYYHTATLLPSGRVLIAGGHLVDGGSAASEIYDPVAGTFAPTQKMAGARYQHTASLLPDGRVLIAGGFGDNTSDALATAEIYDPSAGTWSQAPAMSAPRGFHTASVLDDGRVLVAGGSHGLAHHASAETYSPTANAWSPAGTMSGPRALHTATRLPDGRVLAAGGSASSALLDSADVFDPTTGSWSPAPSLRAGRLAHAALSLPDGRVLLVAGQNLSTPLASSEIYTPVAPADIVGTGVASSTTSALTAAFNLAGAPTGPWDVVVTDVFGRASTLRGGFAVYSPARPAAVADLSVSAAGASLSLDWTSPASAVPLASYDLRRATFPITAASFASASPLTAPAPAAPGSPRSVLVPDAPGGSFFALKSVDAAGGVSALSNSASIVRSAQAVGSLPELSFSASIPVAVAPVSTATAPGSIVLATSTAQGLVLVSSIYDLGPEGAAFTPSAQLTFAYSTAALAALGLTPADILIYQYVPGAGLVAVSSQAVNAAAGTITGYVPSLSSIFAVFGSVKDRTPPVTVLVPDVAAYTSGDGSLYASTSAAFGLSAHDPVAFGTTTGVAFTNYRVDGSTSSPFSLYASTFSLAAEGQRTIWFYSVDRAGNAEIARSSGVAVDATAPVTSWQVSAASVASVSGGVAISSTAAVSLSAVDPLSNGVASGVRETRYSVDGATAAAAYAGPFVLPPGERSVRFLSRDNVGNAEAATTLSVLVDAVAPETVLLVNGSTLTAGSAVILSTDSLALAAFDAGAGVAQILYALDGGAEQVYLSTFSLPSGSRTLAFRAVDRLGNAEAARQAALEVLLYDVTPPAVALSVVDRSTITTAAPVLAATYEDAGRGVDAATLRLTLDGVDVTTQAAVHASSVSYAAVLAQGAHELTLAVADLAGNQASAAARFFVDSVPPETLLLVDGLPASTTSLVVVSTDSLGFLASDSGTGVERTEYSLDGGAAAVYASTFSLAAGTHSLVYRSFDAAGNAESPKSAEITVLLLDETPPSLALAPAHGSTVTASAPQIVASYSDLGRGVDASSFRLSLDGLDVTGAAGVHSSSAVFTPASTLSQGTHTVVASVSDRAGNPASASSTFLIDSLAPVTTLLVNGLAASTTELVLVSTDSLGFAAADSGVGVLETLYSLDGAPASVYVSTFSLSVGTHSLVFHSVDSAGNAEAARTASVTVLLYDAAPPTLSLAPPDGSTVTVDSPLIAASYSDSGRGVDAGSVRLALDGLDVTAQAAVTASSASYAPGPLSQGFHVVTARVADLAGNAASSTVTFRIDSLPPVTTLLVNGLAASTTQLVVVSTDALGFAASDSGTGVLETRYAIDGSTAELTFVSTFSLTAGAHSLAFRSVDAAGNLEPARTVSLQVLSDDAAAPSLSLAPPDGSTVTTNAPLIVASYSDAGRGVDAASVLLTLDGLDVTAQAVVTASSASYAPSPLSEGFHVVTARVADLAGNAASSTATFRVDSLPPVTTLLVNGLAASTTQLVVVSTDSLGFSAADSGTGVLETLYAVDSSTSEAVFVSTFSLAAGARTLSFRSRDRAGNLEAPRSVSLTVLDEDLTPPSLSLAPPHGSTVTTAAPQIVAAYADAGRGVDAASVRLTLDGVDVTTLAFVTASSSTFTPSSALAQGTHTVSAQVADLAGNGASASATFFIDSVAPVTSLLKNGLSTSATSLVLVSTDTLGFSAADAGTGVLETLYSVDGATETVFVSTFTLAPGGHSLAFRSRDRAGNSEAARTVSVTVTSPSSDTTPPLVRLDFPGSSGLGVEGALGGVVNVRGQVSDASSLTWKLESAPGAAATSGFVQVAAGAGGVSGLVAAWNTASQPGYRTLRLSAVDAHSNAAETSVTVYVGNPVFSFSIGKTDSDVIVNKIKNPTGIAVRSDGRIWVASVDKDELVLLTSSGGVVAVIEEGIRDFKNPQGLAVDAADRLYVADKGNDRVVKLSPDGTQVLLQLAKLDNQGKPKPGSGPGEFKNPWDVAVDQNGDIYVADTGNSRIQVFNSSGTYLRQFGQGVLTGNSEVRGIALTQEGLWVSDKEQQAVHLFSRAGGLLKSIGDADSVVGEISRMRGVASDRLGAMYLVEPNRDRTQKFDPQGKGLLSFGTKQQATPAEKAAKRYLTQPIDAAVAPDGALWITDTGKDRIVRYTLPAGGGYGVAALGFGGPPAYESGNAEPARRLVDAVDGARVERDDGVGVVIPGNALPADLEITVEKADETRDADAKQRKRQERKVQAATEEVAYGPEGTVFNAPVTLVLSYSAARLAAAGIGEDDLKVHYWNATLGDWEPLASVVDKTAKVVTAQTNHFSTYQLMGSGGGIGVAAVDDFGFRDAYAFPSPSRGGAAVTFRMQPGAADSIEIHVYDVSGRRVHSSSDFRFRGAFDDGNGKGAQNTYDHAWDVSGVGSGVYTFVMTAKKSGEKDIRKTGKVGVIK